MQCKHINHTIFVGKLHQEFRRSCFYSRALLKQADFAGRGASKIGTLFLNLYEPVLESQAGFRGIVSQYRENFGESVCFLSLLILNMRCIC
jgi:hypothetical protein